MARSRTRAPPIHVPGYYTADDLTTRFRISTATLDRWVARRVHGFPPPTMLVANRRYWDRAAILRWEDACREAPKKGTAPRGRPQRREPKEQSHD